MSTLRHLLLFTLKCSVRVNLYLYVVIFHFLPLRTHSHHDSNDIIFIILVSSNVDVTNWYFGTNWRCSRGNGILRPKIAMAATVWTRLKLVNKLKIQALMSWIPCIVCALVWTEDMLPIPSSTLGCARFGEFWLFFTEQVFTLPL